MKYNKKYEEIITFENILAAWNVFKSGKTKRKDINMFALKISENLFILYQDLLTLKYVHGEYENFSIIEIKKREINKASVRDRVVHQLLYTHLYSYFDSKFIYDSYSCRKNKGTHKAILRYEYFFTKITKNYTQQAWVLKFDIKKCFENVDQDILLNILKDKIEDQKTFNLCKNIICSFKNGLPLGNLTSQLFINIYLNELDRYVKHVLKIKYYIRYADDIVIFDNSHEVLENYIEKINIFLETKLKLKMHKVSIATIYSGNDFLGFKHFKKFRTLRKNTEKKMFKNISEKNLNSYLGILKWGNCQKIENKLNKCISQNLI